MLNKYDAARILGLSGEITPEITRAAWLALIKKYHTDTNPAGLHMAQAINAAYDVLKDLHETIVPDAPDADGAAAGGTYPEDLAEALNAVVGLPGLEIEICGAWVWVGGDTRTHKDRIKAAGFKWSKSKTKWYFRPANKIRRRRGPEFSMGEIRAKWGTTRPGWSRPSLGHHENG